jgi:hypothetical protein
VSRLALLLDELDEYLSWGRQLTAGAQIWRRRNRS